MTMFTKTLAILVIFLSSFFLLAFLAPEFSDRVAGVFGAQSVTQGLRDAKGRFDAWVSDLSKGTDNSIKSLQDATKAIEDKTTEVKKVGEAVDDTLNSVKQTQENLQNLQKNVGELVDFSGAQVNSIESISGTLAKKIQQAKNVAESASGTMSSAAETRAKIERIKARLKGQQSQTATGAAQ